MLIYIRSIDIQWMQRTLRTAGYRLKAIEQEEDRRTVWKMKGEKRLCNEDPQPRPGPDPLQNPLHWLRFSMGKLEHYAMQSLFQLSYSLNVIHIFTALVPSIQNLALPSSTSGSDFLKCAVSPCFFWAHCSWPHQLSKSFFHLWDLRAVTKCL